MFRPEDVKVYRLHRNLKPIEEPIMEGRKLESIYVMSAESTHIDKAQKNEIVYL